MRIYPPSLGNMLVGLMGIVEGIIKIISIGIVRPSWSYKIVKWLMFK